MSDLKYPWLQETLAELIHHTTSAKLYSVSKHLSAALREVQRVDTGHSPRVAQIQLSTVRLALEECQMTLADLGKHSAAREVGLALRLTSPEHEQAAGAPALAYRGGSSWN